MLAGRGLTLPAASGWPDSHTLIAFALALEAGRSPGWLVLEGGLVIGQCAVTGDPVDAVVEISYGLASSVRGTGRGSALVRLFSDELLARPDVDEITARVDVGNVPSQRALLAAGFAQSAADGDQLTFIRRGDQ